ncbi:MAG: acetate--CoA ligase family protein [Candidatus Hadarchaeia archaeon]
MSKKKEISKILESALAEGRDNLMEHESKQVISLWGIPVTETRLASDKLEAVKAARDLKYPVVMKIASPDILDKGAVEGLMIGLSSEIEVRQAFDDIITNVKSYNKDTEIRGVLVQEFIPGAQEVVIREVTDPSFGSTVVFGLSGSWMRDLKDQSFRLSPVTEEEAGEMIREITGYPMLLGGREEEPADIDALESMIKSISELSVEYDEIKEINMDPVFAFKRGKGARVVDARIFVNENAF